jgi:hypothetical protein
MMTSLFNNGEEVESLEVGLIHIHHICDATFKECQETVEFLSNEASLITDVDETSKVVE